MMNLNNIEKYLKKNYKFVIIICLFLFLVSSSNKENFTTIQALDAVKSTEQKVNDMVSQVDANKVTMEKQLHLDNHLSLQEKQIRVKNAADGNHVIFYNKDIDGVEMKGWKGISLATAEGGAKRVVDIQKNDVNISANLKVQGSLCIGNTCINEDHLKMITDGYKIKITDNGSSSTQGLNQYIHNHGGTRLGPHSRYPTKLKMYKY